MNESIWKGGFRADLESKGIEYIPFSTTAGVSPSASRQMELSLFLMREAEYSRAMLQSLQNYEKLRYGLFLGCRNKY